MTEIRVRRLSTAAALPASAYDGDAGLDLTAAEQAVLEPGGRACLGTGIAVEIPAGHAGLVLPRSGLAVRHGLSIVNAPGLIDAGYRGEIRVVLLNTDRSERFVVAPGMRIAQLVVVAVAAPRVVEVDELSPTGRGDAGFGSSGVR